MTIKIDKGVPLVLPGRRLSYPLPDMEVGDSFFAPGKKPGTIGGSLARYKPKKFAIRTVTENGVTGARVWRIE